MKRSVLLSFILITAVSIVSAQTRFGIKAGINVANQNIKLRYMNGSYNQSGDAIVNFHLGGVVDIPLNKHFAFRPELLLSGKGSDLPALFDDGSTATAKMRPYYIEAPLNFVYHHDFPSGVKLYGGAGPSIAVGVFGKAKAGGQSENVFRYGGLRRLDFGFNLLAGVELKQGITISANFIPGVANIFDGEDGLVPGASGIKFKNTCFGFSVGYMF